MTATPPAHQPLADAQPVQTHSAQLQPVQPGTARIAVAYHSGYGHTARQAEAVAAGAGAVRGATAELVPLDELTDDIWDRLAAADAIIFGAPTYMGSPSAVFKAFAEASSDVWANNLGWRDKIAAGFTNSKAMSGDKFNSLVDFAVLAAQHGMIWVGLDIYPGWAESTASIEDLNRLGSWLGAMAQSDADLSAEKAPPETDLRTAAALGSRVAIVTLRHLRGALAA
ncbi:flavodoxin family protein [Kribbella italica]|uniref:Multimeric flavodoxin WrbA n=1 Tax=Kribbella italica TaxID=1540520 RepID=A0A7W9J987_9ACTN|nr:flavodoxin family protein [Kribbella italica]MBB5837492.1 multimeric flavodoxin WrbA [Kribbella italica]